MAPHKQEPNDLKKQKEKSPKRTRNIVLTVLSVFFLAAAAAGYIGYRYVVPLYSDTITPGVHINGIDISGMSYEEALSELTALTNEKAKDISAAVHYGDRIWQFGAEELGANADIEQAVASAAEVARTGNALERYREARSAEAGAYQFDASLTIKPDNLADHLQKIKKELDRNPVEPTIQFNSKGEKFTLGGSVWKVGVDHSPLFEATPGENGIEVDAKATMDLLRDDLADDHVADVELVVHDVEPESTEQSLRDSVVHLYHSSSVLRNSSTDRTWNIQLALSHFDSMVIEPDRVVSYNETLGQRTVAKGYRKAGTIAGTGALVDDVGGGICQASTVLFNAAIQAGCEIVERNPHSWPLYYQDYDWGLDAMVNWGSSDLKFKNTTGANLYLDFYFVYSGSKPSRVIIDIYGPSLGEGVSIKMKSTKVSETPPPPPRYEYKTPTQLAGLILNDEWTYDPQRNLMVYEWVKPRTGYVYDVFRLWMKDGEEIKREKLYASTYRTIQGVHYTKDPAPTPHPGFWPG